MQRVEIVALFGTVGLLGFVLELVRRRKLGEGYSVLWLLICTLLIVLSLWRELLEDLAGLVGIFYPPSALFAVAFAFLLLILLHLSVVVSTLSAHNRQLSQKLGIVEWRLRQLEEQNLKANAIGASEKEAILRGIPRTNY